MIWLLFKKCGKKKKSAKSDETKQQVNNPKQIIQSLLPKLDAFNDWDKYFDKVFITDKHFACLSVIDPYHEVKKSIPEIIAQDIIENDIISDMTDLEDSMEVAMKINNRCSKVTESHLKSLQCPFNWGLEPETWTEDIVNRIENKYGKYNKNLSTITFSFEKYVSNLVIGCGLFKTNKIDEAHEKLINIWEWLDNLDNADDSFYFAIRDGLKHIIMSTLCHVIYTSNRVQCHQLFESITRFNFLDSKSKSVVYAIRAAVCIEIGGKVLQNAIQFAKKACDFDPDTAYWYYFHSVAMTAQRQYLNTNKSCPTEAEFDNIQHAVILVAQPNPYFDFHRMVLMTNKILYHYHLESSTNENPSDKIKQDLHNIVELNKAIVSMEPEDPHIIVKCAKSLMTLPYFNQDTIHLVKQIISIAVNMAFNDTTVIQAIERNIEIYGELVDACKERNKNKTNLECILAKDDKEDELENDLKLIVEKYENGSDPVLDLIYLMEKYDGKNRWKIMSQICSYSILFKNSTHLLVSVEQFMALINDRTAANSEIVTNHRSVFIKDHSKIFNLADLVCNQIKLAITLGHIKNQDEIQFYLDQLTKIMEVCQLKSKTINPIFIYELIDCGDQDEKNIPQQIVTSELQNNSLETKQIAPIKLNKQRRIKQNKIQQTTSKNQTLTIKPKPRKKNYRYKN